MNNNSNLIDVFNSTSIYLIYKRIYYFIITFRELPFLGESVDLLLFDSKRYKGRSRSGYENWKNLILPSPPFH